eukprot:7838708-Pyramimonas_sp.AAC.1
MGQRALSSEEEGEEEEISVLDFGGAVCETPPNSQGPRRSRVVEILGFDSKRRLCTPGKRKISRRRTWPTFDATPL